MTLLYILDARGLRWVGGLNHRADEIYILHSISS